jgi:hemerythrin-like domain-containing protein
MSYPTTTQLHDEEATPLQPSTLGSAPDGMEVLDVCHRQILFSLGKLSALIARLATFGPDAEAREMAREISNFLSTTVRLHHEDEERHVFPKMLATGDPELVQAVLRLQTDHRWLEEDWLQLAPHIQAVASGQSWYDLDLLRDGAAVFTALLHDHLALEESLIYPQARDKLHAGERREMGREMAARRRAGRPVPAASA